MIRMINSILQVLVWRILLVEAKRSMFREAYVLEWPGSPCAMVGVNQLIVHRVLDEYLWQ
jgi:hypothetical protein